MIGPSMDYLEHQYDIAHGGGDDADDFCDECGGDHDTEYCPELNDEDDDFEDDDE